MRTGAEVLFIGWVLYLQYSSPFCEKVVLNFFLLFYRCCDIFFILLRGCCNKVTSVLCHNLTTSKTFYCLDFFSTFWTSFGIYALKKEIFWDSYDFSFLLIHLIWSYRRAITKEIKNLKGQNNTVDRLSALITG